MDVNGKVAVVTGGASGIGAAVCRRLASEGALVVVADVDEDGAKAVAGDIGGEAVPVDVSRAVEMDALYDGVVARHGRVDVAVHNAGICPPSDGSILDVGLEPWRRVQDVNLAGVYLGCRAVLPYMLEQGSGYLLNVASAAGLLVIFDTVSYTVTKHAAIGLAEWLAATYIDQGIGVSVLCPAAVRTPILAGKFDTPEGRGAITTDELAEIVIQGLAQEHFMISTHPWVLEKFAVKARDYDEYIATMRAGRAAELTKAAGA